MQNLRASYAVPFAGPSTRLMTTNGAESGETNADPANGEDVEGKGGWLVGEAVEKAQLEPGWEEKLEVRWPFRQTKALDDWDGREFILYVCCLPPD